MYEVMAFTGKMVIFLQRSNDSKFLTSLCFTVNIAFTETQITISKQYPKGTRSLNIHALGINIMVTAAVFNYLYTKLLV